MKFSLTNESRDYFNQLLVEARKATPFLEKPIALVPEWYAKEPWPKTGARARWSGR